MIRHCFSSLALHLCFLISLTPIRCGGSGEGRTEQQHKNEIIIPKGSDQISVDIIVQGHGDLTVEEPKEAEPTCPEDAWYGGIGIMNDYINNSISAVFEGYPAHKSGLLVGDIILFQSESDIRGKPGTNIVLTVKRGFIILTFNIVRDKICIYR